MTIFLSATETVRNPVSVLRGLRNQPVLWQIGKFHSPPSRLLT